MVCGGPPPPPAVAMAWGGLPDSASTATVPAVLTGSLRNLSDLPLSVSLEVELLVAGQVRRSQHDLPGPVPPGASVPLTIDLAADEVEYVSLPAPGHVRVVAKVEGGGISWQPVEAPLVHLLPANGDEIRVAGTEAYEDMVAEGGGQVGKMAALLPPDPRRLGVIYAGQGLPVEEVQALLGDDPGVPKGGFGEEQAP